MIYLYALLGLFYLLQMVTYAKCHTSKISQVYQKQDFYVFPNYVPAKLNVPYETITLTTPGDFRYMDAIALLSEKWRGPISVAMYAPGNDFLKTLQAIAYYRNCMNSEIRNYVSFHLFFEVKHIYKNLSKPLKEMYQDEYDCRKASPFKHLEDQETYRSKNNLLFPINVARNIAREAADTKFIFPSDIELIPTENFIPKFMRFAQNNPQLFQDDQKNVFVLPVFEMKKNYKMPRTKTELRIMLKKKTAFLFHVSICRACHHFINEDKWAVAPESDELDVFSRNKRHGAQVMWEPFYVCTQKEPWFDERLSWEGQGNKMSLAYSLCLQDYNFLVLDNAFLMHIPGIKGKKMQDVKYKNVTSASVNLLRYTISQELRKIYGNNKMCRIL